MTYDEVLADWKALFEDMAPAEDMTGGYVDQDDLHRLLMSPTKATAKGCLLSQIHYWFQVGPDASNIEAEPVPDYAFSGRFPRPSWFKDNTKITRGDSR